MLSAPSPCPSTILHQAHTKSTYKKLNQKSRLSIFPEIYAKGEIYLV